MTELIIFLILSIRLNSALKTQNFVKKEITATHELERTALLRKRLMTRASIERIH